MFQNEQDADRTNAAVVHALREHVERRQLTLTALSRASRIPRSTLYGKLRGDRHLTVAELVRLAIALDVPSKDLLAVDDEAGTVEEAGA